MFIKKSSAERNIFILFPQVLDIEILTICLKFLNSVSIKIVKNKKNEIDNQIE